VTGNVDIYVQTDVQDVYVIIWW